MASPLIARYPQCISCFHRTIVGFGEGRLFPAGQQIRGKKKMARGLKRVNALLVRDVKGYGKKGSVMSVAPGVMRNQWYPNGLAEYVTDAKLAELGLKKEDIIERGQAPAAEEVVPDTTQAGVESEAAAEPTAQDPLATLDPVQDPVKPAREPVKPAEPETPTPEQPMSVLARLLPSTIELYRSVITTPQPAPKKISPSLRPKAAISSAASGAQTLQNTTLVRPVSTEDVATDIMALLHLSYDGPVIPVAPEEISFVQETGTKDSVKSLGTFEIEIRLKGASDALQRTIKVSAKDS